MTERKTAEQLPNDIQTLKKMIIDLQRELSIKTSHFNTLAQTLFGSKSEKKPCVDPAQQSLFDEAECESAKDSGNEEETEKISYTRKKKRGGRKPFSDSIPRRDVVININEEDKECNCGHPLVKIGEEVSEQLNVIPAVVEVIRTIRPKYACSCCQAVESGDQPVVKIAELPPKIIGPVIAAEGLLAHIVTGKFCDALPLYRQEKIFSRMGADISRKNTG